MSLIELEQINHFCLGKQHLTQDAKIDDVVQIAKDTAGLHATCPTTPYLSLLSRSINFKREYLDEELYVKRTLGKVRSARKTVYVLPKEIIPVAFAAIRGMLEDRFERYMKYQGFTRKEYENTAKSILGILQDNGMPTTDIKKALGIKENVSAIVNVMCDQGLLIRGEAKGGWNSNTHTYYVFQEYLPDVDLNQVDELTAKELLIKKYITAFAPVTVNDASWWTGFTRGEVSKIVETFPEDITHIEISNLKGRYFLLSSDYELLKSQQLPDKPMVNFLPALDSYLMGYKERGRYLCPEQVDFVFDGSGNVTSTILINGRIAGIWDFAEEKGPIVKLFFFADIEDDMLNEIYAEASRIGKFIADKKVDIKKCASMVPLTKRAYGGFMAPLKHC
jgi:hypothetical protein